MTARGVPNGISKDAYRTASRVVAILEDAGYDVESWWEWGAPDSYNIDFNITASAPHLKERTVSNSTLLVSRGETDEILLRLPTIEAEAGDVHAPAIGQQTVQAIPGMGEWGKVRVPTNYFGDGYDIHIESSTRDFELPDPIQAARQAARVRDAFEEAVFDAL